MFLQVTVADLFHNVTELLHDQNVKTTKEAETRIVRESDYSPAAALFMQKNAKLAIKEIVLCWSPSHIGILGNEMVDQQAKISLSLEPTSFKIPFSNFRPSINKYILEEWQTSWNNIIWKKLLDIKINYR